jgi:hypothetical protein
VNRIPLFPNPPLCSAAIDTRASTDVALTDADLLAVVHQTPAPGNPCLLKQTTPVAGTDGGGSGGAGGADGGGSGGADGGADGGPPPPPPAAYFALFQNQEVRFVLSNMADYVLDNAPVHFDVHGGFVPDSVIIPATISIGLPARIVSSPLDTQTQLPDLSPTHEIPFLFVVDQRRLAAAGLAAARGQVLRIHPREPNTTLPTLLPIYQDATDSNNLWPIQ